MYKADLNKDQQVDYDEFKGLLLSYDNKLSKTETSLLVKILKRTIESISTESQQIHFRIFSNRIMRTFTLSFSLDLIKKTTWIHLFISFRISRKNAKRDILRHDAASFV